MNDPGLVEMRDRPGHRDHQRDRDTRRHGAGDALRQAPPGDQFEDEVETAVLFARVKELDDVAMADLPERLRLAKPASAILRPDPDAPAHDLDGHATGEPRLPRLIDDPHSPPPQLALDHETGDRGRVLRQRRPLGLTNLARRRIRGQPLQEILTARHDSR